MLGRFHGSVEHFYVPKLIFLNMRVNVGGVALETPRQYNLFRLGWEEVDKFKRDQYVQWVEKYWKEQCPAALRDKMPGTLPPRYDDVVNGLVYALPHDYQIEILHFTQLYYNERHRVRKFDTVIREMCHKPAETAINTAFRLLADCVYDQEKQGWLRDHKEVDKRLIGCLLRYKFWREATGHGLVWDHAGLDELDRSAGILLQKGRDVGHVHLATKYRRCLTEIKEWEADEERFRNFISVGVGKTSMVLDDMPPMKTELPLKDGPLVV